MADKIRVRIAPSPTGEPHVGTAYIALFDYCMAGSNGGDFILRIEDTDQTRSTQTSEKAIFEALNWLGLTWSEGPDKGGPYGPYRQSERLPIYRQHSEILLNNGNGYRCFCTSERLDIMRKELLAQKKNIFYDGRCRSLSKEESDKRAAAGETHVVRLAVPRDPGLKTSFFDAIRKKEVEYANSEIDDQILLKTDGFPTYHLANVVDDHLMKITHVIRAEEWIPSTPKHVLLYRAFGWTPPVFAHVSLLRNADKSKVSKRKNPVSLNWFRAAGYTREAIINFLGLMGYSTGTKGERFGIKDILDGFSLDNISTSSPVFDLAKLNALNEEYIRKYSPEQYVEYLRDTAGYAAEYLKPLLPAIQERHKVGQGFAFWTDCFFRPLLDYSVDTLTVKDLDKAQTEAILKSSLDALDAGTPKTALEFENLITVVREKSGVKTGPFMMVLRVALTGSGTSLPLFESMAVLGRDRSILRLKDALAFVRSRLK